MSRPLAWEREGRIWPHRDASEFVPEGRHTWHVQRMGAAGNPKVLLLHGTGASVHSWRGVMPMPVAASLSEAGTFFRPS